MGRPRWRIAASSSVRRCQGDAGWAGRCCRRRLSRRRALHDDVGSVWCRVIQRILGVWELCQQFPRFSRLFSTLPRASAYRFSLGPRRTAARDLLGPTSLTRSSFPTAIRPSNLSSLVLLTLLAASPLRRNPSHRCRAPSQGPLSRAPPATPTASIARVAPSASCACPASPFSAPQLPPPTASALAHRRRI